MNFGDEATMDARLLRIGVGRARRHLFLCVDPAKPKCAPPEVGIASWARLKERLSALGLGAPECLEVGRGPCILRTRASCLRVCRDGPVAVVYPEGIWYGGVTPEVVERILVEHLVGGRPVEEFVIARAPLPTPDAH